MIILAIDPATRTGWAESTIEAARALAGGSMTVLGTGGVSSGALDLGPFPGRAARPAVAAEWTKGRPAVSEEWSRGRPARPPRISKKDGRVLDPGHPGRAPEILREGKPAVLPRLLREARPAEPAVPAEPPGARFARLRDFLERRAVAAVAARQPLAIVAEGALPNHRNEDASRCAYGLSAVLREFSVTFAVRLEEIKPYDLQRWVLGRQAKPKSTEMLDAARARLGFSGEDDNEADALWLLAWAGENLREGEGR